MRRPSALLTVTLAVALSACTLEEAAPEVETFQLEVHGRYVHSAGYVTRVLAAAGLTPRIGRAILRNESGLPVGGLVIRAARRSGDERD